MINSGGTPSDDESTSEEDVSEIMANDTGEDIPTSVEGTAPAPHKGTTMPRSGPNTVPQGDL